MLSFLISLVLFSDTHLDVNVGRDQHFDSIAFHLHADTGKTYQQVLSQAKQVRRFWLTRYEAANGDSVRHKVLLEAGREMEKILLNGIFPFWYGTPWDFNGYTNVPGEGVVACGYFVSTTLKHVGMNLNRYKLAQQGPKEECYSLALGEAVHHYKPESPEAFTNELMKLNEGLYFVGLDNHVGYLLHRGGRLFFIHSNYVGAGGVDIEEIHGSQAFQSSGYYIAAISGNHTLVKKWLTGEEISVAK